MRRLARWACVLLGLSVAARAEEGGDAPRARPLRVAVEAVITLWEAPRGSLGVPTGRPDQLAWDAIGDESAPGVRVGAAYRLDDRDAIEVRGTWLGEAEGSARETGVFGFGGGVSATNTATLDWSARLAGVEANWRRRLDADGGLELLAGLRWVGHTEEASATDWLTSFGGGAAPFVAAKVDNRFLGAQVGAAWAHAVGDSRVDVAAEGKVLLGSLQRDIEVSDRDFFSGGSHFGSIDTSDFAAGLELELAVRYRLHDRVTLALGYDLFWLDGVTRAHEALDFSRSGTGAVQPVSPTDRLLLHSFLLSLTARF